MAFVDVAIGVGTAIGWEGISAGAATMLGGAVMGAGAGALYNGLTGRDILTGALYGGAIGGVAGGLGAAFGNPALPAWAQAGPAATAVNTVTPAMQSIATMPTEFTTGVGNMITEVPTEMGGLYQDAAGNLLGPTGQAVSSTLPASALPKTITEIGGGFSPKQMLGYGLAGSAALSLLGGMKPPGVNAAPPNKGTIRPYNFTAGPQPSNYQQQIQYDTAGLPVIDTAERNYFAPTYSAFPPYKAAQGGLMAAGGSTSPVENMSTQDMTFQNPAMVPRGMFPQGQIDRTVYAVPSQRPASMEVVKADYDTGVNPISGMQDINMAAGGQVKRMDNGGQTSSLPQYKYNPANQTYTQIIPTPSTEPGLDIGAPIFAYDEAGMPTSQYQDGSTLVDRMNYRFTHPLFSGFAQLSGSQRSRGLPAYVYDPSGYGSFRALAKGGDVNEDDDAESISRKIRALRSLQMDDQGDMRGRDDLTMLRKMSPLYAESMMPKLQGMVEGAQYGDRMTRAYGGSPRDASFMPTTVDPSSGTYGGIASIGQQLDPETRLRMLAHLERTPYDRSPAESVRRVGAGISRQLGKDSELSAYYEQDPRGREKSGGIRYTKSFEQGGGVSDLGSYSDGGRMLKGPGDGMSDNIPGVIGGRQPARLADGEFVIPADVVSHLGNGSTDAGAKRLYAMMDEVRKARTGTKKQGKQIKAEKYLPK